MRKITCKGCGHIYVLPPEYVGRRKICRYCGEFMRLGSPIQGAAGLVFVATGVFLFVLGLVWFLAAIGSVTPITLPGTGSALRAAPVLFGVGLVASVEAFRRGELVGGIVVVANSVLLLVSVMALMRLDA